ncbi:DUF547 domain-containing protein [Chloroflexota bacterium]
MTEQYSANWKDGLIQARNGLLDRITGVKSDQVLNATPYLPSKTESTSLAAEVKMAMDEFKIAAMDEDGYQVNYARLRESKAYGEYRDFCAPRLRFFDPAALAGRDESLAFWINLYNALVLDGVINFSIQNSVTEDRLGVLAFFRKTAYEVAGLRVNLEDIEHGILRANRGHPYIPGLHFAPNDPRLDWVISKPDVRIHFALNCASRSCPPIRAYTAEGINTQLDQAGRGFVDTNVRVDQDKSELHTSAIFNWYKIDFGGKEGVVDFIIKHLPNDERRTWIEDNQGEIKLRYDPYNWGLNLWGDN